METLTIEIPDKEIKIAKEILKNLTLKLLKQRLQKNLML
jgi:hypothetical protein